jgi:hypothetical protein
MSGSCKAVWLCAHMHFECTGFHRLPSRSCSAGKHAPNPSVAIRVRVASHVPRRAHQVAFHLPAQCRIGP